ncbi:related to D-lactate dehydrogenase, mitochondrial precursor [Phialocephala subalpina]|uniref:D-lactate dehydrogenase (cytochrome) n=1 Tax=Phialocephala subalpina TaxID=576137 RepID=A0A1L7WHN2_9HELO|nr:related to D-lactate dehydrogenase, mitochondrial precursor [Phialocephala subalpina]
MSTSLKGVMRLRCRIPIHRSHPQFSGQPCRHVHHKRQNVRSQQSSDPEKRWPPHRSILETIFVPNPTYSNTHILVGCTISVLLCTIIYHQNENHKLLKQLEELSSRRSHLPDTRSTTPLSPDDSPKYDLSPSNLALARTKLESLLDQENVTDQLGTLIAHSSTSWSPAPNGDLDRPSLIVYPLTTSDVSNIAKICHEHRIPMIAFSGGTSLEGTLAAQNGEICIDFKRMNKILEINKDNSDVVVQPGVGYEELNEVLAKQELLFPPDPGPGAQIGGMIAQGCSGTNAYRYGTMKDWVLGLTVVLADGTVIQTRHRPRKSSAGYDLTRLIVASEGTLGFVTEASLKVTLKPKNIRIAVASFPTIHKATGTTLQINGSGHQLEAMELLDDITMHAVNEGGYTTKTWPVKPTIFFKFAGDSEAAVQKQIDVVEKLSKKNGCEAFVRSKTDAEADALWAARKTALWSLLAIKRNSDDQFLSADVCVPIGRLADCIEASSKLLQESGLLGSFLGHVGDGNFHTTVLYSAHEKEKARKVIRDVQKLGVEMQGTVSGEHGIGLENRDALVMELGEGAVDAMRAVKRALDPLGLLNPGKVFRLKLDEEDDKKAVVGEGGVERVLTFGGEGKD